MPSILLLLFSVPFILADNCPKGYVNTTVDGSTFCYKVYKTLLTHDQAEATCQNDGGTLVKINGPNQNAVITNATHGQGTSYIGVRCRQGNCIYDDGRLVSNNSLFYGGTPTPEIGSCVVLDTQPGLFYGKWLSVDCSSISAFVCQVGPPLQIDVLLKSGCNSPFPIYGPTNITSPGYPSPYSGSINCAYFLAGGPYRLYFDDFSTGTNDVLATYYKSTSGYYSPQYTYTGSYSSGYAVTLNYVYSMLTFVVPSTNANQKRGFSIRVVPYSN